MRFFVNLILPVQFIISMTNCNTSLFEKKVHFSFFFLLLFSYCEAVKIVDQNDPNIEIQALRVFYKQQPFTGKLKQEIPALNIIRIAEFKNGLEDGETIVQTKEGILLEKRYFLSGAKHGIHTTWYPNGKLKTKSEFFMGSYVDDRWEWYMDGKPAVYEKFSDLGKLLVTKKWRPSGGIYMNIVYTATGASVGLPGSKICEPIKGENK